MQRSTLRKHINLLGRIDSDIAQALEEYGYPATRPMRQGFEALFRIVISQQISKEAATSVFQKAQALLQTIEAETVQSVDSQELRNAGLSTRKVEYVKGIAEACLQGELDFERMKYLSDKEIIELIQAQRGLGRWSAEIFLMFSLNRKDVFAADDLALRHALTRLKRKRKPLSVSQARKAVEHWAPYRTAGSIFLWHYYRGSPQ
ncbi:MAG: hypothetical protein RH862_04655 [Leptospiraceae bacterium]